MERQFEPDKPVIAEQV